MRHGKAHSDRVSMIYRAARRYAKTLEPVIVRVISASQVKAELECVAMRAAAESFGDVWSIFPDRCVSFVPVSLGDQTIGTDNEADQASDDYCDSMERR